MSVTFTYESCREGGIGEDRVVYSEKQVTVPKGTTVGDYLKSQGVDLKNYEVTLNDQKVE